MHRNAIFSIFFSTLAVAGPANAVGCADGAPIMDAVVVLPSNVLASVTEVDQYAWLGQGRLVHVCDIHLGSDARLVFDLYAGEFRNGQGICMSYTTADGTSRYSCATPSEVEAARAAPRGAPTNTLRFSSWSRGLPSF